MAGKIEDFGEYIPGARKEYYCKAGIFLGDLENIPESEFGQLITRDMVWPEDNYVDLVENKGYEPAAAYYIRTVRRIIPAKPNFSQYSNTQRIAERFVAFIHYMKNLLLEVKTLADADRFRHTFWPDFQHREFHYTDPDTGVEVGKTFPQDFTYTQARSIEQLCERKAALRFECRLQRFPYHFRGDLKGARLRRRSDGYKVYSASGKLISERTFSSEQEVYEYADSGELDNELDAKKQTKKVSTVTKVVRPQLDHIERVGPNLRYGRNARPEHLLKQFNLRGGQFGNWNSQDDRQAYLNYAYDGLVDLAAAMGVPTSFFAFEREGHERMGLAFGARGKAGAAAHYEPELHVINLTKMNGAGSMAHEFGHGMDYWLAYILRDYLAPTGDMKTRHVGAAQIIKAHQICQADNANPRLLPVLEAMKTVVKHMRETEVDVCKKELVELSVKNAVNSFGTLVILTQILRRIIQHGFIEALKERAELTEEGYETIRDSLGYCSRHKVNLGNIQRRRDGDNNKIDEETISDFHLEDLTRGDFVVGEVNPTASQHFLDSWIPKANSTLDGLNTLYRNSRAENFRPDLETMENFVALYDKGIELIEQAVDFEAKNCLIGGTPLNTVGFYYEEGKTRLALIKSWTPERIKQLIEFDANTPDDKTLYPVNLINPDQPIKRQSRYLSDAEELDANRRVGYYATTVEMFARAFEHYIEKKLKGMGVTSQYLVHSTSNGLYAIFGQRPYPESEESRVLCEDFDVLLQAILDAGLTGCEVFEKPELYSSKSTWVSYAQNVHVVNKKAAAQVASQAPKTIAETDQGSAGAGQGSAGGQVATPDNRVAQAVKASSGLQLQLAALAGKPYTYSDPLKVVDNLAIRARNLGGVACGYVNSIPHAWKKATHSGILRVAPNQQGQMTVQVQSGAEPRKTLEAMLEGNVIAALRLAGVGNMTPEAELAVYVLCRRYGLTVRTYNITKYSEAVDNIPGGIDRVIHGVKQVLSNQYIQKVLW